MIKNIKTKIVAKASEVMIWHENLKHRFLSDGEYNYPKLNILVKGLLSICMVLMTMGIFFYPELLLAADSGIGSISDLAGLKNQVKSDIQTHAVPIVLNAAGIGLAAFALIVQRWTMLFFGAAYLVFVNVFFGFVNGQFGS